MKTPLADKIYPLYASLCDQGEPTQSIEQLRQLSLADLLVWLTTQKDSLRYNLALELDIPLQHLNATCETVKKLSV